MTSAVACESDTHTSLIVDSSERRIEDDCYENRLKRLREEDGNTEIEGIKKEESVI